MAWGPPGKTKYERVDFKTKAALLEHMQANCPQPDNAEAKDFVECHKEGDKIYYERERNNHRSYIRYVGRRPSGMTYCYVVLVTMS